MIHLLEKELEKQALEIANANANANNNADLHNRRPRDKALVSPLDRFWPTLAYSWLVAALLLSAVFYRIYCLAQQEVQQSPKAYGSDPFRYDTSSSSANGLVDATATAKAAAPDAHLGITVVAESPLSPQCYKRAPGSAPIERQTHV